VCDTLLKRFEKGADLLWTMVNEPELRELKVVRSRRFPRFPERTRKRSTGERFAVDAVS
jgi:hypothetical protein